MRPKQFLLQLLQTLMPHKYKRHSEKKMRQVFELYFGVIIIGVVLSFLIFIPVLKTQSSNVVNLIDSFDVLNITIDVETNKPVTLVNHPLVILDTNASERGNARYLLGENKLFYKKNIFKEGERELITNIDLTSKEDKLEKWFFVIVLILLPAYVLSVGILTFIISILIVLLFAYIARLIFKKKEYTYRACFMSALHASIPAILVFLVALPFLNLWWVSSLIFIILYFLGLLMVKGYKFESVNIKEE